MSYHMAAVKNKLTKKQEELFIRHMNKNFPDNEEYQCQIGHAYVVAKTFRKEVC